MEISSSGLTPAIIPHSPMHPILLSLLLGLTAAVANVFGGTIIVQKHWDRSYLKYFMALGAGFMLATAMVEIIPASLALTASRLGSRPPAAMMARLRAA